MNTENIQQKVLEVTKNIEKQVDAALEHIDNLDINDLEQLRKQRMQELKLQQGKRQEWLQKGHGSYEELAEERMFFDTVKKSENVVIHFFTPTNTRSPIVDKHFKILASKHIETKFVSLNAEKCPFLAERLRIKVIPAIVCIKNAIMIDKIVGFTQLGNRDDFSTELLEWRLAQNKIIEYDGDLSVPPDQQDNKEKPAKRTIRDGVFNNESDDDLELEDCSHQFEGKFDIFANDLQGGLKKYNQNYLTPEEELELGLCDEEENEKNAVKEK
ncbi:hypothetical protein ILUMI_27434 [Ignelater luminosus]|uniref:Thioredoxin domain-containing protein n=1 Tax=Ignelater luminosus TaxID=2038154 RepID=A0A8K0C7Y6_IGNLU|nr:hypothetical protein ILUMI_27434 [Ignelater luminosus]